MNCLYAYGRHAGLYARICAGILVFLSSPPLLVRAQPSNDVPTVTRTFALENVRIVQAPGRVIENGTVLIRDGLIVDVGLDVAIPFDAERIAGDSLSVYAGFIDGLSHAGIPAPPRQEGGSPFGGGGPGGANVNRADPPNDQAGIQPERAAPDLINPEDGSIASLRQAGFTAAHVVPRGLMLPGSGALILLAGDDANKMVLKRDVSMFAQIEGARRVYPATPMGVMAKMRQLYREAARRKQIEAAYAANATAMPRPEYDPIHYAFFPVIDGAKPVFMYTGDALDIYRALRLQTTLGYRLVLAGLNQSFESIDLLLDADVPLLLTLDLPDEPAKEKADSTAAPTDSTATPEELPAFDPSLHVTDHTDTTLERINLKARQRIFYHEYLATAASLYNAGLNFGFTTKDVKPEDIHKNIRKMIEQGLPEDAALAALTTRPADILDVSQSMGTVEPGKIANLVVTKGPLFQEKTKVKYVFVDGNKFEYDLNAAKPGNGNNGGNRGARPGLR